MSHILELGIGAQNVLGGVRRLQVDLIGRLGWVQQALEIPEDVVDERLRHQELIEVQHVVARCLQHLVLIVRDGGESEHLVKDVELCIGALFSLFLLLEQLALIL